MSKVFGKNARALVTSVRVNYNRGEFTKIELELVVPTFGIPDISALQMIDFGNIFNSDKVKTAIQESVTEQMRQITMDDQ